jgi:perosamine synthetase
VSPLIPISSVSLGADEQRLVLEVLKSGRLAQGPMVERLETDFAREHDVRHAVAVNNGTTALVAAIQAVGLRPGDEVITSPLSFVATLNAILEAGATVRFADIGEDYCLDPAAVETLVSSKTKAIMPVHLFGLPADMTKLGPIAHAHGLAIIEDAAQAHGARIAGRSVGSFGIGCFSLYATKNITAGEGGLITTNDDDVADRLRLLRNQGMRARYEYEIAGHNYRMTELQAAIAIPQLGRLRQINHQRRANAATLTAGLADVAALKLPAVPAGREHVFHQYTVQVLEGAELDRDGLAKTLAEAGVATGIYYPRLMHDYDCYRGDPRVIIDDTPLASRTVANVLSLPVHPLLSPADLERICAAVRASMS